MYWLPKWAYPSGSGERPKTDGIIGRFEGDAEESDLLFGIGMQLAAPELPVSPFGPKSEIVGGE